jgi:hypothetical protein
MAEACSGLSRSMDSVSWFATRTRLSDPRTGQAITGYWSQPNNRIVLAGARKLDGETVRHESLHALLRTLDHPRAQFLEKCAGVVDCSTHCIADAGPARPQVEPNPIGVTADAIEIGIEADPAVPSAADTDGFFTLTVTARNPASEWVFVELEPRGTNGSPSFSFDVSGLTGGIKGGELAFDRSVATFAPGEMKRYVFDFIVGGDLSSRGLTPGKYEMRGAYNHHWGDWVPLVLTP